MSERWKEPVVLIRGPYELNVELAQRLRATIMADMKTKRSEPVATSELKVDPARYSNGTRIHGETGIHVRAKLGENWSSYDIADLDEGSLRTWLRSRGGSNPWAESTVAILLGHPHPAVAEEE